MKRILIIDNDTDVLDVMQEALKYEGYEVNTLADTNNIFTSIEQYYPDIVLIDYILDGINGGELCHQIKHDNKTAHLPVVLMSAYPRVVESLGNYGCDKFVAKPFDLYDLTFHISCLLSAGDNTAA